MEKAVVAHPIACEGINVEDGQNILMAVDRSKFVEKIVPLSLSEQEELFTRTLDLSPLSAPYVGYHVWGESYKRGEFMAALNKEMKELGVDLDGELPAPG